MQTAAEFLGVKVYGAKYNVVEERNFPAEVVKNLRGAEVVEDSFGNLQVCFHMAGGARCYKALSTASTLKEGDAIKVNSLKAIELSNGENTIIRVDGEAE